MASIGARCNLVPVIAKADMLTTDELTEFKAAVRALIAENRIRVFTPPILEDEVQTGPADEAGSSAEIFVIRSLDIQILYSLLS
jgi:cell division control protein 12